MRLSHSPMPITTNCAPTYLIRATLTEESIAVTWYTIFKEILFSDHLNDKLVLLSKKVVVNTLEVLHKNFNEALVILISEYS